MIVAALPVLAVAYLLGGIRLVDIGMGVLAVFVVALLVATMVVAVSTFAKRVQTATLLAYAFTALLSFIGPLALRHPDAARRPLDRPTRTPRRRGSPRSTRSRSSPTSARANRASGDGPLSRIRELLAEVKAAQRRQLVRVVPEARQLLGRRRGPLRRPAARRRSGGVGAVDGVAVADRRRPACSSRSAVSAPRPRSE